MGVAGSGKSTLAAALAHRLGWPFQEGDDLHPPANIAKMAAGRPLDDADRSPWLTAVRAWMDARAAAGDDGVVTCSALRRAYRRRLLDGRPEARLLFIDGDPGLIATRLSGRSGHFMPASLLDSQFATLEPPGADERPIVVQAGDATDRQVDQVIGFIAGAEGARPPPPQGPGLENSGEA